MSNNNSGKVEETLGLSDLGKLGKKWVKKYGLSIEQAMSMELDAADAYAHGTRDGWCCACDADIAFAIDYLKDEPEFQAYISSKVNEARISENKFYYNMATVVGTPKDTIRMETLAKSAQDRIRTLKENQNG